MQVHGGYAGERDRVVRIIADNRAALCVVRGMGHHRRKVAENVMIDADYILNRTKINNRVLAEARVHIKDVVAPAARQDNSAAYFECKIFTRLAINIHSIVDDVHRALFEDGLTLSRGEGEAGGGEGILAGAAEYVERGGGIGHGEDGASGVGACDGDTRYGPA